MAKRPVDLSRHAHGTQVITTDAWPTDFVPPSASLARPATQRTEKVHLPSDDESGGA